MAETALAIFRLNIRSIARASGGNAVAAAAYTARETLHDERLGKTYDFRSRGGLAHAEILVPQRGQGAAATAIPERSVLWNQAERAEHQRNSRVALEFQYSLPHELNPDARIALARRFAQAIADHYGGAVDLAVHNAPAHGDPRNVHAHALSTVREYSAGGLGAKIPLQQNNAWRHERGLPHVSTEFKQIRARLAEYTNETLLEHGIDERVDARTLWEQGIRRRPQNARGPVVNAILRRGGRSYVAERMRAEFAAERERELERTRPSALSTATSLLERRRQAALDAWRSHRRDESREHSTEREAEVPDHAAERIRRRQHDHGR